MNPLRPAIFKAHDLQEIFWESAQGGLDILQYMLGVGSFFPSVMLAFSAHPGNQTIAKRFAENISKRGVNVFLSRNAVPISALSIGLVRKGMPLGIYISEIEQGDISVLPIGPHGGPVGLEDLPTMRISELHRNGVLGDTDLLQPYLHQLTGLLDPYPTSGPRLGSLKSPFQSIESGLTLNPVFQILTQREEKGPIATISPDGQSLRLELPGGRTMETPEIVQTIGRYLGRERFNYGTVVCPAGTAGLVEEWGTPLEISGDSLDMSHQAIFSDFLLGWWEPGTIAHQGHSPFGDAYLSLIYLLEAWTEKSGD